MAANTTKIAVMKMMRSFIQMSETRICFSRSLPQMQLLDGDIGRCVVKFKVGEEHTNPLGTLHGGVSSAMIDQVTTMALVQDTVESLKRVGVSVNMSIDYMRAGKVGDEIVVDARCLKRGKTLAFLEAEVRDKDTNNLLVKGSHVKYVG